jgi:hypothetical protein
MCNEEQKKSEIDVFLQDLVNNPTEYTKFIEDIYDSCKLCGNETDIAIVELLQKLKYQNDVCIVLKAFYVNFRNLLNRASELIKNKSKVEISAGRILN